MTELSACGALVQQHDRDRYLSSLFAPEAEREALFVLDVVTNDTNPNNVLLDETGPQPRFVLVDGFGDTHPLGLKKRSARLRHDQRNRRLEGMARFLGLRWDATRSQILRD